ncbi:MAG: alpha-ketoglutarate-dependent dioxygenase AlkB [Leptospiraceae bacterium]|nr:alpha-ketoglutarate-dependent dioxygenase AlkB [Leptospiraceae bacterium]
MTTPSLFQSLDLKSTGKNLLPRDGELLFYPNFFKEEESDFFFEYLLHNVKWQQDKIWMFQKYVDIPRLNAWYGEANKNYSYSGIPMKPNPWLPQLVEIKNRIETISNVKFTSTLINLYRDGKDSVDWHADDERELGKNPVIGSVSFGETRVFKLRHLKDKSLKTDVELTHGSFALMRGETQHFWEHKISKTAKQVKPRINLTFRVIHS